MSKELFRCCLLYDFKVGLSAAASSRRICQAFGNSAVNERTARHWFQKFRSGDFSVYDESCVLSTSRQVVHYELLQIGQTVTEDLYSQQLERMQQALQQKEPAVENQKVVHFLHDNARPQVA